MPFADIFYAAEKQNMHRLGEILLAGESVRIREQCSRAGRHWPPIGPRVLQYFIDRSFAAALAQHLANEEIENDRREDGDTDPEQDFENGPQTGEIFEYGRKPAGWLKLPHGCAEIELELRLVQQTLMGRREAIRRVQRGF